MIPAVFNLKPKIFSWENPIRDLIFISNTNASAKRFCAPV